MKKLAFALLALPLAHGAALAQEGNPAAGKAYWDRDAPRVTLCRACHGASGEGAFGPDLAGRGLNAAQVARAVHQPWGVMPAFTDAQFSDPADEREACGQHDRWQFDPDPSQAR
jgi:mono/diheme cytochrome c family protein